MQSSDYSPTPASGARIARRSGNGEGESLEPEGHPRKDSEKDRLIPFNLSTPGAPARHEDDGDSRPWYSGPKFMETVRHNKLGLTALLGVLVAAILLLTLVPSHSKHHPDTWQYPVDPGIAAGIGPSWWPDNPSVKEEARGHFNVGLRLLHLFWYDQAKQEFQRAISVDPSYAMGYWGLAMTCKQMLWQTEDEDTAHAALQDMQRRAKLKGGGLSALERQYVQAAQKLWKPGAGMEEREKAYAHEMKLLHGEAPDDPDACALYALSLLSQVANTQNYLTEQEVDDVLGEARHVLGVCTPRWWDHGGLLHYTTHAYDYPDPAVVEHGLAAGIHLSEVAPAACHAQHMKSHLFLQLGNWSQVVDSNFRAVRASDAFCGRVYGPPDGPNREAERECDTDDRYHALEWWLYGLTQQCAFNDARALLGRMLEVYSVLDRSPYDQWALRMWAHVVMQSHAYPDVPAFQAPLPAIAPAPSLKDTLSQVLGATNITNALPTDEDIMWEIHARASALTAAAYALTLHANNSAFASGGMANEVQIMHARIQDALAFLARSVPESMPYLSSLVSVNQYQVRALQLVSLCVRAGTLTGPGCSTWLAQMELAVDLEAKIWDNPSAPSLHLAPAEEMYGHLLLLTQQQPERAASLFAACTVKLPHRQSCVLGSARAAALVGDAPATSMHYAALWQQCAPAAAPPDYLWPGLMEAFWAVAPAQLRPTITSTTTSGSAGSSQPVSHEYWYSYGQDMYFYPPLPADYTPLATDYQVYIQQHPPPYPVPADVDPRNHAALQQLGYSYGSSSSGNSTASGVVQVAAVGSYPAGLVVVQRQEEGGSKYTYVSSVLQAAGYWPPFDALYTDALRTQAEAKQAAGVKKLSGSQGTPPRAARGGGDELRRDRALLRARRSLQQAAAARSAAHQ